MTIKAPDISMKGPIRVFEFEPFGMKRPVTVYFLNRSDFTVQAGRYGYSPREIKAMSAFAAWNEEDTVRLIYMTVEGIQHFAHELRHLQERADYHGKGEKPQETAD